MIRSILLALSLVLAASAFAAEPAATAAPKQKPYPVDMVSCRDGTMTRVPVKPDSCSQHGGVGAAAPAGSTAVCKDGTFSDSKETQQACAGHKGVDRWLNQ